MDQNATRRKTSAAIAGPPWMKRMRGMTDQAPYIAATTTHTRKNTFSSKAKDGSNWISYQNRPAARKPL
jgi:hypothetical protein